MDPQAAADRLDALKAEHRALDAEISALNAVGGPDRLHVARLKRRKLRIKDEIARLQDALVPPIIA